MKLPFVGAWFKLCFLFLGAPWSVGGAAGEDYGDHCAPAPPNFNVGRRGVLALAALAGVPLLCSVGTTREKIVRRLNIEIWGEGGTRATTQRGS